MKLQRWIITACWVALAMPQSAFAQESVESAPAQCTNRDVVRGLFNDLPAAAARCPVPAPTDLLELEHVRALGEQATNAPAERRAIAALRAIALAARAEPQWGPGFAARVEALLEKLEPSRCDSPWEVDFSAAHAPNPDVETCQCAFEVGSAGSAGHACFRFPQPAVAAPACPATRVALYDLADWRAAARAYQFHSLARASLLDLQSRCRGLVVTRLATARARWYRLLSEGYVQYPWELWASRLFASDYANYTRCFASDPACTGEEGLDPESLRLIFLHPGVGLGFPGFGRHDGKPAAQGRLVIALEAVGANLYLDEFKQYVGVSALVGFQDADFARPRVGALLHLSRFLQVGYLFGLVSETQQHGTLYLSIDILGWSNRSLGLLELEPQR